MAKLLYVALSPKAIMIVTRFIEDLNEFIESQGARAMADFEIIKLEKIPIKDKPGIVKATSKKENSALNGVRKIGHPYLVGNKPLSKSTIPRIVRNDSELKLMKGDSEVVLIGEGEDWVIVKKKDLEERIGSTKKDDDLASEKDAVAV